MRRRIGGECLSEELLKVFYGEASISGNTTHGKSVDGIVSGNSEDASSVRHDDVLPLANNAKPGFLKSLDSIEVVDAGNLGHG